MQPQERPCFPAGAAVGAPGRGGRRMGKEGIEGCRPDCGQFPRECFRMAEPVAGTAAHENFGRSQFPA